MIYIDIDETVRDLLTPIEQKYGVQSKEWITWNTKINGKGFCSFIDKEISANAPLTEFGKELQKHLVCNNKGVSLFEKPAMFLSGAIHVKETVCWLNKHFKTPNSASHHVIFVEKSSDKYKYLKDCDWFIDDCPTLALYPDLKWKWICIPQPYNFGVNCYRRTNNMQEVKEIISAS